MTIPFPDDVRTVFETHEAYEMSPAGATVTTTAFEGRVTAGPAEADWATQYTVTVTVPTLSAAVDGQVGAAVAAGWLDTLERRLEDAPKATRASIDLDEFEVTADAESIEIRYTFTTGNDRQAADVAKTFVEYVEGTYVEGIVPGYDYLPPVSNLLNQAQSGGSQGERGGTPL